MKIMLFGRIGAFLTSRLVLHYIFVGLLEERNDTSTYHGQEDEVYLMQASLCNSERERDNAMMLCKNLLLEESYQAWTRALGRGSEAGRNVLKGGIFRALCKGGSKVA